MSFVLTVLMMLVTNACISEFEVELPAEENDVLVVTGDIIENSQVDIVLSKVFPVERPAPPPESQNITAIVTVVSSDGSQSAPATSMGHGVYRLDIGELKNDVGYGLKIECGGNVYTSELSKPFHTPALKELSWKQPEPYGDVYFHISTGEETSGEPQYFMWSYREDWEFLPPEYTEIYYDYNLRKIERMKPQQIIDKYICWKSNTKNNLLIGTTQGLVVNNIVNKQILNLPSESDRFSTKYCLTVSQKAVSKAAYEYYKSKKTENEEMGGIFTPQPNEVSGNITCSTDPNKKTVGFVSVVKNISTKRVFVDRGELIRVNPGCDYFITPEQFDEYRAAENLQEWEYASKYDLEPLGTKSENYYIKLDGWVLTHCIDCVAAGGTKNKPDFWPEKED